MGKSKQIFFVRKFLNRPSHHSIGSVYASVDEVTYTKKDKNGKAVKEIWIDASLTIADCTRQINLELDSSSKSGRENTLHKLDILIDTLTGLRRALAQGFDKQTRRGRIRSRRVVLLGTVSQVHMPITPGDMVLRCYLSILK